MKKILLEKLRFHEALYKITGVKRNQDVLMLLCSPKRSPFPVRGDSPVALRAGPVRRLVCWGV